MIKKYSFGSPIETDAVVKIIKNSKEKIKIFDILDNEIFYNMDKEDCVYGLGESVRGINKRGYKYISNCSDDFIHSEDKSSLYGAHNFIIVDGVKKFGLFIDTPSKCEFDIGYTNIDKLKINVESNSYNLYIIEAESCYDVVKQFRSLIGRSYIPPKWAFGYGQSRWSYFTADEAREVVKKHRENNIPLDSLYLDIDYMDDYKDFTINENTFPEFDKFVDEMKNENIHLVPIIDAGVKIEKGYDIYEEGIEKGHFCKDKNGKELVCGVWPGDVHFPDFLNKDTRNWFGQKYKFLLDKGIEGFWNDMNEPAIFYTKEHLKEVFDEIENYKNKRLDVKTFFEFQSLVKDLSNNKDDYKRFFHNYKGETIRHDKVHNLFGYNMTRAAGEAFDTLEPNKRILMFSRASYIGAHRYGGLWHGDNCSWWSHIKLAMSMSPSLNMCGFLFNGCDTGGFSGNCTEDLMLRWLQFSIFTPLMRNHSALGTRKQEVYEFDNIDNFRNIINLRYGLIPYIYSEYVKAALNNSMYIRPLAFDYTNDKMAKKVEDQLLVGESIMIAPVYEQNKTGRYVYLPEKMKMLKIISIDNIEESILDKGHHYIEINLNEVLIFIRKGKVLPIANKANSVSEIDYSTIKNYSYDAHCEYDMYDDDGYMKF